MSSGHDLKGASAQANKAPNNLQDRHDGSMADTLDGLCEHATDIADGPYQAATQEAVALGMSYIQSEMSNFTASCDVVMKALDVVAQIHPFVTVAVVAFKTAIKFELTRRQNDRRMRALHINMKDMMSAVALLRGLAKGDRGTDGLSIEHRLRDRMIAIAKDVETCAETCDKFQKKRFVVKVFKSLAWEGQLEGFAAAFDDHKEALHQDLAMHASIGISQANQTLARLAGTTQTTASQLNMVLLFKELRSPEERDLRKFIEGKGGAEVFLRDDALMSELITKSEKDIDRAAAGQQSKLTKDVQRELKTDLAELLRDNQEVFSNTFAALQDNIRTHMESTVTRDSDRVIGSILAGPHDRLIDPIVHEVWTEMGWKGSAKARHVVMALREFFAERYSDAIREISITSSISMQEIPLGDTWALEYISIQRIQPLLEAIDDDASSFITVSEMNAFTTARPSYWSLIHWIAYWIVGFPLAMQYYSQRIRELIQRMTNLEDRVLSSNRDFFDQFMGSVTLLRVDALLAGAYSARSQVDWYLGELFSKFERYIVEQETQIRKTMNTIKYNIDTPGTLTLLQGSGRLEKHLLPLVYIVLERTWKILEMACRVPIHYDELQTVGSSLYIVQEAIIERVDVIKAMCKLTDSDPKTQLRKFACGLYYYIEYDKELTDSPYTCSDVTDDALVLPFGSTVEDLHDAEFANVTVDVLTDGPQDVTVDLDAYRAPVAVDTIDDTEHWYSAWRSPMWQFVWRGYYTQRSWRFYMNCLGLEMPSGPSGTIRGTGEDTYGPFTIEGRRENSSISLDKDYPKYSWKYKGTISDDNDEFVGYFGVDGQIIPGTNDRSFVRYGYVELKRKPIYYWSHRPDDSIPRVRALWQYALSAITHAVRTAASRSPWAFFEERRKKTTEVSSALQDVEEIGDIERSFSPADVRFYRSLARALARRAIVHCDHYCQLCLKSPLLLTRVVCLDCSTIPANTDDKREVTLADLCAGCSLTHQKPLCAIPEQGRAIALGSLHRLLQVRRSIPDMKTHELLKQKIIEWEATSGNIGEGGVLNCIKCVKPLSRPFWCCFECPANVQAYVCMECNQMDDENYIASLMQSFLEDSLLASQPEVEANRHENESGTQLHRLWHTLILCLPDGKVEEETKPMTVEERLGILESRMTSLEGGMRRLEGMLGQLLHGAVLSNST